MHVVLGAPLVGVLGRHKTCPYAVQSFWRIDVPLSLEQRNA